MSVLRLVRGPAGCGKTSLAASFKGQHIEADMFFDGQEYDPLLAQRSHQWCEKRVRDSMEAGLDVNVSNQFTNSKSVEPYMEMAKEHGYDVVFFSMLNGDVHSYSPVEGVEYVIL